jgi:hypothetical protein
MPLDRVCHLLGRLGHKFLGRKLTEFAGQLTQILAANNLRIYAGVAAGEVSEADRDKT